MAAGKNRKPRRIQEVLDGHQINMSELGRQVGVTPQVVWNTVNGRINNRKVLRRLLELGAPEEILDLPPDFSPEPSLPIRAGAEYMAAAL